MSSSYVRYVAMSSSRWGSGVSADTAIADLRSKKGVGDRRIVILLYRYVSDLPFAAGDSVELGQSAIYVDEIGDLVAERCRCDRCVEIAPDGTERSVILGK